MIRLISIGLMLFLLPGALWWAFRRVRGLPTGVAHMPLLDLAGVGIGLVILAAIPVVVDHVSGPAGRYVPAHVENGVFQPDRFEP